MDRDRHFEELPVADLGTAWGPRPSDRMIEHVRQHGVLTNLLVAQVPDDDGVLAYRVIDGNRRLRAAQEAGLETVPATVITGIGESEIAELTLALNTLRNANPVTEWWAIDDLLRAGHGERTVAERTGMTPATIKARARYGELDPRIFSGLVYGRIAPTVVEKAARLPHDAQDRIGELFEREGSLQTYQVEREAKKYRQPRPLPRADSEDDLRTMLDQLATSAVRLGITQEMFRDLAGSAHDRARDLAAEDDADETDAE